MLLILCITASKLTVPGMNFVTFLAWWEISRWFHLAPSQPGLTAWPSYPQTPLKQGDELNVDLPRTILILKLKVSGTSLIPHKLGWLLNLLFSILAPSCLFCFIVVCVSLCLGEGLLLTRKCSEPSEQPTGIWLNAVDSMGGLDGQWSDCGQPASFTKQQHKRN